MVINWGCRCASTNENSDSGNQKVTSEWSRVRCFFKKKQTKNRQRHSKDYQSFGSESFHFGFGRKSYFASVLYINTLPASVKMVCKKIKDWEIGGPPRIELCKGLKQSRDVVFFFFSKLQSPGFKTSQAREQHERPGC